MSSSNFSEYSKLINHADGADYAVNYETAEKKPKEGEEGKIGVLTSVFNLSNSAVGAGILALPYAISQCGLVLGPILMLVMAALMSYTLVVICQTASLFPRSKSYETLVKEALGGRSAYVMAGVITFQTLGSCTSYMIIIADSFTPMLSLLPDGGYKHYIANRAVATLIISLLFILPLALQKQMAHLRFSSALSVLCVCYIVFVVVFRSAQELRESERDHTVMLVTNSNTAALTSIPLIVFAFRSHTSMPPIHKELKDNENPSVIKLLVFLTLFICAALYYVTGIFGYLTFFGETKSNILNNFSNSDVLALVARGLLIVVMICHYPVVAFCCRSAVDFLIFRGKPVTTIRNAIETIVLWGCFFGISIAIPQINVVLGLAGSLPFSEFLFPAAFIYKFNTHKQWTGVTGRKAKVIAITYACLAGVISVTCSASIVYKNWIAHDTSGGGH